MKLISELIINKTDLIKILVPKFEYKYNYFYKPTESLHICDQITIVFQKGDTQIELAKNMLDILFEVFKETLNKVINNQLILPKEYEVGKVGYAFNICVENENENDGCFYSIPSAFCNNETTKTWLYNKDNKIYLEISPLYPWLYREPRSCEKYVSFEEYIKTYSPFAVYEISSKKTIEWLAQCNLIVENADR